MIRADCPGERFALPLIHPACWVCTVTGELFRTTPGFCTSNCEYVLTETPAPLGLLMSTCGRPFAVWSTVGACAPAPVTCASTSVGTAPNTTSDANAARRIE